jgi:hypothetical protein
VLKDVKNPNVQEPSKDGNQMKHNESVVFCYLPISFSLCGVNVPQSGKAQSCERELPENWHPPGDRRLVPAQPNSGAIAGTGGWGGLGNRDRPFGASSEEDRSRL